MPAERHTDIAEEPIQLGNDTELVENEEEERNIFDSNDEMEREERNVLFDFTYELILEPLWPQTLRTNFFHFFILIFLGDIVLQAVFYVI